MPVCTKCGLPLELCICETIAKEAQKIKVLLVKKRYGKTTTVIKGIDTSKIDVKELLKTLKRKLACGGTYKNNEIELQGDHRERVKTVLVKEGFPSEIIEVL
ncbi:MAG TPA: stress response translation initiation inhibitor YciH [archaeon]|nr:stress response translation initiation inhibitor YciH [archaeon]